MLSQGKNKLSPETRDRAVRMVLDHEAQHPLPLGHRPVERSQDPLVRVYSERVVKKDRSRCRVRACPTTEIAGRLKSLER